MTDYLFRSHDLHVLEKTEGEGDEVLFFFFDEAFGSVAVAESRHTSVCGKAQMLFVLGEDVGDDGRVDLRIGLEGECDFTLSSFDLGKIYIVSEPAHVSNLENAYAEDDCKE